MEIENFSVGSVDSIFYIPSFLSSSEQAYILRQVNSAPVSKWKSLRNRRLQNWGGVVHEKGLIAQPLPSWLTSLTQRITTETGLFPSPINHVLVNEYKPGQGIMPHQDGPLYFPVVAIVSLGSPTVMQFSPHQSITEAKEEEAPLIAKGQEELATANPADSLDGAGYVPDQCVTQQGNPGVEDHETNGKLSNQKMLKPVCPKDVSLILMPGSLLIFKDSAYKDYLHGIEDAFEHKVDQTVVNMEVATDGDSGRNSSLQMEEGVTNESDSHQSIALRRTGTRISLTCRLISKVQGKFLRL